MSKAKITAEERPYHHGDLHRAIVNAALEVLSETQSTEFSLRELSRRAGVTHNAPYKHFADKRELLAAVSAVNHSQPGKRRGWRVLVEFADASIRLCVCPLAATRSPQSRPSTRRLDIIAKWRKSFRVDGPRRLNHR